MESDPLSGPGSRPSVQVSMLGALTLYRNGASVALPASRKVRAVFGYLALAPAPVTRSRLCELLWDVPDDPRGELRWSLSKVRGVLKDKGQTRIGGRTDAISMDLSDAFMDVAELTRLTQPGVAELDLARLREANALCTG